MTTTVARADKEDDEDDDYMISNNQSSGIHKVNDEESIFRRWLSKTNVTMKQIDLSCKVIAPAVTGFLIPLLSQSTTTTSSASTMNNTDPMVAVVLKYNYTWPCLVIGFINIVALITEYVCTTQIFQRIPALSHCTTTQSVQQQEEQDKEEQDKEGQDKEEPQETTSILSKQYWNWSNRIVPEGIQIYSHQSSFYGGMALAVLYTNSLTMGNGIMTTYLLYRGLNLRMVGTLRGIASVIGLLGTCVYHVSAARYSTEWTGLWSITYQFLCLVLALLASSLISNTMTSLSLLIGCVCLSRIGLWVFDIAITQLQQQEVPDHIRGRIGGVQTSLNNGFYMLSFGLGLVIPDPKQFPIYVAAGVVAVGTALIMFLFGLYLPRRKLVTVI